MKPGIRNIYKEIFIATAIGALVGFFISLWRDKTIAIFLCAAACGGVALVKTYFGKRKKF